MERTERGDGFVTTRSSPWRRRAVLGGVGLVAALVAWWIGAAVIPRWWAQRVSGVIDGRLVFGSVLGLFVGFVCTAAPLAVVRLGWRFREGWRRAIGFVIVAVALAAPNLATLGIVRGDGNAAHAGERILDVDGPGFRGGSLIGALAAVAAVVGLWVLLGSRRRNRAEVGRLRRRLDAGDRGDEDGRR